VACGGGCVNTQTDPASCGSCGHACSLSEATASCVGGLCAVASCATGWGNCDGIASNGCEVNLSTNVSHCGACSTACTYPEATASCVSGVCALGACATGWGNCDAVASNGCEVDLYADANNCGSCGHVCASGQVCSGGTCGTASNVLQFPLSSDTTHILSGTNYWNAGDYVDGSRVAGLTSSVSCVIHIVLTGSLTACGTQSMEMLINGTVVGTFAIVMGQTTVDTMFNYAAIAGPTYDLRYQTTATVASGCGSMGIVDMGSTVTLQ
jgi:hypothetical protein